MWASRFHARSPAAVGLLIRFLFIGSRLCSTLLSDPASRRSPCASLSLLLHQDGKRTFTSQLLNMLGTQEKGRSEVLRPLRSVSESSLVAAVGDRQSLCRLGERFFDGLDAGFAQLGQLHVPDETDGLKGADQVPVKVHLVPCQSVARRLRMRVMVVVPAFAEAQQR